MCVYVDGITSNIGYILHTYEIQISAATTAGK